MGASGRFCISSDNKRALQPPPLFAALAAVAKVPIALQCSRAQMLVSPQAAKNDWAFGWIRHCAP